MLVELDGFDVRSRRDPHRGDEPARHARPRAAAPGSLRSPDRRRPPRSRRAQGHPARARARQAARRGCRPRRHRASDAGNDRSRSREPAERSRVALGAARIRADRDAADRERDRTRHRRTRTQVARDLGARATGHRVSTKSGHALVAHALPTKDPVHKISIIPRGRALGYTLVLPTEDRLLRSRRELEDEMAMLLGGRTAEELKLGDPTTGAHDDIDRATEIARRMVTEFGMSDAIGPGEARSRERRGVRGPRHGSRTRVLAGGRGPYRRRDPALHRRGAHAAPARSSRPTRPCSIGSPRRSSSARRSTRPRWRRSSRRSRSGTVSSPRRPAPAAVASSEPPLVG